MGGRLLRLVSAVLGRGSINQPTVPLTAARGSGDRTESLVARAVRNAVTRGFGDWVCVTLLQNGEAVYSLTHVDQDSAQEVVWDWNVWGILPQD